MATAQNGARSPSQKLEGRWRLISGSVGPRVGLARGILVHLRPNDLLEFELQQATVTPLDEAGRPTPNPIGVSGNGRGAWRIVSNNSSMGSLTIELEDLSVVQLRIHARRGPAIPLPAQALQSRIARQLAKIEHLPMSVVLENQTLTLLGSAQGIPLVFQFEIDPTAAC